MATKHTPGPWVIDINKDGGIWTWSIRTKEPHNPAGNVGIHVAECNRYLPNVAANAALIAQAPALKTAVQRLLSVFDPHGQPGTEENERIQAEALAILAASEPKDT